MQRDATRRDATRRNAMQCNTMQYNVCMYVCHAFFVYYENADLVYDVIRMRQLSEQTLHELSPNDYS